MLNCRQVTRLISQSMDAKLSWHRRLAMRIHLLYCVWCRRYATELQTLRKATSLLAAKSLSAPAPRLSDEAKAQMRARLKEISEGLPPSSK